MAPEDRPAAILLATYNGARYLPEFLDSLCAQTFQDFCLYARDDQSTDDTLRILSSYADRLAIHLLPSHERLGAAGSFFQLIESAAAGHEYYLLADQDDVWLTDKIERAVAALRGHADDILLYCTRTEYVDARLQHLGFSPIPRVIAFSNAVVENIATGCTIAFTRRLRREVLTPQPHGFTIHDWWLYMFGAAFGTVIYDARPSLKYRQHGNNTIGVPSGLWSDFRRRWKRFVKRDGGIHLLSRQTAAFLACYGARMKPADRRVLLQLRSGVSNARDRLSLALHPPVLRQSRMDTWIMRLLFLIGRY
jgi:glycosyltransferase involved in cell wall biosynthesis